MGMQFTVLVRGEARFKGIEVYDTSNFDGAESFIEDEVGDARIVSAEVTSAEVSVEAELEVESEVSASDMADFDAENALDDAIGYNGTVSHASFEVTDSPSGFDIVEGEVGRETALSIYAALDSAGFEVS